MIKVEALTISFNDKTILEDLDLTIPEGCITNILGESGTGKSVLMKIIDGLLIPDRGKVFVDGNDIFFLSKKKLNLVRRKIAMLFQGSALLDSLNVFQNVALPLVEHADLSQKEIYEKVADILNLLELQNTEKLMPSELSGGMKKRIALARAIILQPKYIIYDEPTTGLDPIISAEIIKLIKDLQNRYQITTIVVSHDLNCIENLRGNIVMLHNKKIIFDGKYKKFIDTKNPYIKKFLGNKNGILSR